MKPESVHPRNVLGASEKNAWRIDKDTVDLVRPPIEPSPCRILAEPQSLVLDLNRTAVVVVDMQKDFCTRDGWFASRGVDIELVRRPIPIIADLVPRLRAAGSAIVWLNWGIRADVANLPPGVLYRGNPDGRQPGYGDSRPGCPEGILVRGSAATELVDELVPEASDFLVHKHRFSGFHDNELDSLLRNRQVTTLLFAGVNLDRCVFATLSDASFLGYDCIVVKDACATVSPQYCSDAIYFLLHRLYGFSTTTSAIREGLKDAG